MLRGVDANGTLVLRVAGYSLFIFPTGVPAPWDPTCADPWQSLPPRTLVADERVAARPRQRRSSRRSGETNIEFRDGPSEPGPRPLLAPGERLEGHLVLTNGGTQDAFPVGRRALELGIILGRYSRCAGDTLVMSDDVSRVHAMLVTVNGSLHIVDAGSTNGTRSPTHDTVKCEPVVGGATYRLGRLGARWEPTH